MFLALILALIFLLDVNLFFKIIIYGFIILFFLDILVIIFYFGIPLYLKYYKNFFDLKFSHYFLICFIIILVPLSMILKLSYNQILIFVLWFIISWLYIKLIKSIILKSDTNQTINESKFFGYMISFIFIIIFYIVTFSLFYYKTVPIPSLGYIIGDNETLKLLSFSDSLFYSGFNFFTMDYANLKAQSLLNAVVILEVFTAQIIIIVFIGVIASKLLEILRLKK